MNSYLLAAGILTILLGFLHSILGEILIFRHMRQDTLVPTNGGTKMDKAQLGIVWASWHVVSIFGWSLGAIILGRGMALTTTEFSALLENSILLGLIAASLMILIGTKGRHPAWLVLLVIAFCFWKGLGGSFGS